jgi:hypothetical protein
MRKTHSDHRNHELIKLVSVSGAYHRVMKSSAAVGSRKVILATLSGRSPRGSAFRSDLERWCQG